MSTKMLFEPKLPLWLGEIKENIGLNNIYLILRIYKMFKNRFRWTINGKDYSEIIEKKFFLNQNIGFTQDSITSEIVVCDVDKVKEDYNNMPIEVNLTGGGSYKKRNLKVGKDALVYQTDSTNIPPIIYLINVGIKMFRLEDIIVQQNNMLRKPIIITGEGMDFDNMVNNVSNVLSGVEFINLNKGNKGKNLLTERSIEVLNLQLNNSYKGKELWECYHHYEDWCRDYLGYPSVNNEKKERMITDEVNKSSAMANTSLLWDKEHRERIKKDLEKTFNAKIELECLLDTKEEEVENDGDIKKEMA